MKPLNKFIRDLKKHAPRTPEEFRRLGYKLSKLGEGAYRSTYRVHGMACVAKFPHGDDWTIDSDSITVPECVLHSAIEYKAIQAANNYPSLKPLKRYVPEVYYFEEESGVIVMKEYKRCKETKINDWAAQFFSDLVEDLHPRNAWEMDFHHENLGKNEIGDYVILDLGLLQI